MRAALRVRMVDTRARWNSRRQRKKQTACSVSNIENVVRRSDNAVMKLGASPGRAGFCYQYLPKQTCMLVPEVCQSWSHRIHQTTVYWGNRMRGPMSASASFVYVCKPIRMKPLLLSYNSLREHTVSCSFSPTNRL